MYDEFLNKEYSPSKWSDRLAEDKIVTIHGEVLKSNSDLAHETIPYYSLVLNSESEEQRLEVFYKNSDSFAVDGDSLDFKGRKVFIYIHGGYWQWGSVYWSSFMARNFVDKDVTVVALGHDIAPKVTLTEIVSQVEWGVAKILANAQDSSVYICGHSAGAHLAAMMLHTDFKQKFNIESNINLRGLFLVSGVYDLTPLLETDINDNLKMDLNEATSCSPLFKSHSESYSDTKKDAMQVLVVYGENESPSFKAQSNKYADHLRDNLKINKCECHEIAGIDHFNIIEDIRHDDFSLTQEIYQIMQA